MTKKSPLKAVKLSTSFSDMYCNIAYIFFNKKHHGFIYTKHPYDGQLPEYKITGYNSSYILYDYMTNQRIIKGTLKDCLYLADIRIKSAMS